MNRNVMQKAFRKSLPVMAGYIVLGAGFGILLESAGYGVLWSFAMSTLIYAGSLQYVGVSMLTAGASLLTAALTSLMVNARHLFYGIAMLARYRDAGKKKPYLIFSLTDETYSLLCDGEYPEGEDRYTYWFLVSMFNQIYWVTGSVIGSLIGSRITFSTAGIEFSMTALFISAFTEQWITSKDHIPAMTGLFCSLICLLIFGSQGFLIPSMLMITAVLALYGKRTGRIS
jgi:4-azaleucine resistance transporter AzlC